MNEVKRTFFEELSVAEQDYLTLEKCKEQQFKEMWQEKNQNKTDEYTKVCLDSARLLERIFELRKQIISEWFGGNALCLELLEIGNNLAFNKEKRIIFVDGKKAKLFSADKEAD